MNSHRSGARRSGRVLLATVAALGLVVGACSKKDDGGSTGDTKPAETAAPVDSGAPAETTAPAVETTAPVESTVVVKEPVYGGDLVVSGEAEVSNAWTPAAIQCDQYCYVRAGSFYETLTSRNADGTYSHRFTLYKVK